MNPTLRASMPPTDISRPQMSPPRLHRARHRSLGSEATSITRSSFESRFQPQTTQSWITAPGTAPSTRTLLEANVSRRSIHDTTRRPTIPNRATSWNGQQDGGPIYQNVSAPAAPRPTKLMKPQRLAGQRTLSISNVPGDGFAGLPREILSVILEELRKLHLDVGDEHETCPTCYMRDLCSLCLTNRKVSAVAQFKLFERIWLVGRDSQKRFKKSPSRLTLLRRTLDANSLLASYVLDLKVPDIPETTITRSDQEKYFELVASVIAACPNLERLLGLYPAYNYDLSRLTHALSMRKSLTEHVWNIYSSPHQRRSTSIDTRSGENSARDPPFPERSASFLSHHYNWPNLRTLIIHCNPGGNIDAELLSRVFNYVPLPSLAHLALSAIPEIPADLFESLPPLQSLHLSNLPSLTSHLLSSLARAPAATSLTSLHLHHTNLNSLPVLTRLLSSLTSLARLTLIQDDAPVLPIGTSIFLHPYLASATLVHLTWDILHSNDDDPSSDATNILAKAIRHNGFPSLKTLKCPTDYDGILQSLCRPADRILHSPSMGIWKFGPTAALIGRIHTGRKDSGISVSVADSSDSSSAISSRSLPSRSLRLARHAAQSRIDAARLEPKFYVVAEDWSTSDRRVTARFEIAGFVGTVGSPIRYCLEADLEGKDEVGVRVEDLLVEENRAEVDRTLGCDGRWNAGDVGAKGRKIWGHRERVRWKPVEVKSLFL